MKKLYHIFIFTAFLSFSFVSCGLFQWVAPDVVTESCYAQHGNTLAGYVIEIQGIPDITKVDINKTVRTFSKEIENPNLSGYSKDYSGVAIFYDWEEKAWYASKEYYFPNETPTKIYEDFLFGGGLRSKKFQIDPSQDRLRLWIDSYEQTCRSSVDESIPDFKKRISFLSFRLYYNDKIYDAARLLHYEKGKMFIDKNKVTRVQPTPETKSNFYPPFFMKKPGYILSTGLHEVQFSNLEELVPPAEVVKK